jgi:serpin B
MKSLPNTEKYKLHLANSIWFTDDERFTVNEDFLQINADYYGAGAYKAPFDDSTLEDINNWVKKETDGMIPKVLDEIPPEAVMYLVNALAFEAEWAEIYNEYAVSDGTFTKEDGTKQSVEFMYSDESTYLEDDKAIGFKKYYKDRKYAFVALLPNEGVSVDEYIASLDGAKLNTLLSNAKNTSVSAKMPKFETEYDVEMSKVLQSMGMINAFDGNKADFSGLGTSSAGNLRINRVIHKTFISVAEKGTKAGASTVVEVTDESAPMEVKRVFLDRPFVYMLVDCENNLPFFIGTMMDIEK